MLCGSKLIFFEAALAQFTWQTEPAERLQCCSAWFALHDAFWFVTGRQ